MSKCPLQIYLNEKYFESCPSVRPSSDVIKKNLKECYESKYKVQKHEPTNALENDKIAKKILNHKDNSILKEYLAEHRKSIEAYYDLQKRQEEVLNLCKEKLAKRFPSYMNAILKDDDIIKALKIAENNECSLTQEHKSCDKLVRAILNVILSNENQQLNSQNCIPNNEQITYQKKDEKFRTEVSVSEYFNRKRRSVFGKFLGLFIKQQNTNRAYLTCSDNYFNNSKYVINGSTVGLLSRYPKRSDCKNPYSHCNYGKNTFKHFLHKLAGDSWHAERGLKSESSGTSVRTDYNKKMKSRNYITYYCNYQKDVDLLKSEIRKQQDEIKSIQKNLKRCLHILSRFGENSTNTQKFLKHETKAFHVFTNEYRGFQNPAEPYARFYGQYRAEGDVTYADPNSSTSKDNQQSNSSNDKMKKKCCCFKKKSKKKKRKLKQKHSKELQTTPQDSHPKSSVKENQTSDVKFSEELVKVNNVDEEGFETVKSGDGSDAKAKSSSDTTTPDGTKKKKCCCTRRCQKRKAKSRIKKQRRRDKGSKTKKRDNESKADLTKDEKPRKNSCFIRFCKLLLCSSCCT